MDAALTQFYQANGITPSVPCDDATFMRRVWLDVAGRTPPVAEVRKFLAAKQPDKRSALIDELLASQHAANHFGRQWTEYSDRPPSIRAARVQRPDRAELPARRVAGEERLPHVGRRVCGRRRWQRHERPGQFPAAIWRPAHAAGRGDQQKVPRPDDAVCRVSRSSVRVVEAERVLGPGRLFRPPAAHAAGRSAGRRSGATGLCDGRRARHGRAANSRPRSEARRKRQSAVQSRLSAASWSGRSVADRRLEKPSAAASR